MINNYFQILERLSKASGLASEEIERKIEAKRAKLSGLISKEGAAQIVAAELGVSFEKQKMKVNELLAGMKKVNVVGKIIQLFRVVEYKKENREGKVVNMVIADETGNVRTVMWDTNHIKLIEDGKIKQEDVIEITNAIMRDVELHLTGFSDIKLSQENLEDVKREKEFVDIKVAEVKRGGYVKVRGVIMQLFEPKLFEVCPECNKKVIADAEGHSCETHGKVIPLKRALLSLILDDGSANIRAVLFSEQIEKLGLKELEGDGFLSEKQRFLGEEMVFSGQIRQNKLFNNLEFFISDIDEIDVEKLIEELEKS